MTSMPGACRDRGDERARDLRARGVAARVRDAVAQVTALAGERDVAGSSVSKRAPSAMSSRTASGPLGDEDPHRLRVAQPGARDEGVALVLGRRVVVGERRGDAALRPAGRALVDLRLGHDQDAVARRARVQRGGEPGDAGADDDDVGSSGPARAAGAVRRRGRRIVIGRTPGSMRGVVEQAPSPRPARRAAAAPRPAPAAPELGFGDDDVVGDAGRAARRGRTERPTPRRAPCRPRAAAGRPTSSACGTASGGRRSSLGEVARCGCDSARPSGSRTVGTPTTSTGRSRSRTMRRTRTSCW